MSALLFAALLFAVPPEPSGAKSFTVIRVSAACPESPRDPELGDGEPCLGGEFYVRPLSIFGWSTSGSIAYARLGQLIVQNLASDEMELLLGAIHKGDRADTDILLEHRIVPLKEEPRLFGTDDPETQTGITAIRLEPASGGGTAVIVARGSLEKTVATGHWTDPKIAGYLVSPFEKRIAIIVSHRAIDEIEHDIVGARFDVGFKRARR
jgi:hypothetical protein